jgi:Flp pilus assembly protein TadD
VIYSDASRARLVMSFEACELSDLARAMVPIEGNTTALADTARVLVAARRFLDAAVVVARLGGASWQDIGDELGLSASGARERFAAAEARFHRQLHSTDADWRAYMVREPLEAAEDLDDWVGGGDAPVSGGLAPG